MGRYFALTLGLSSPAQVKTKTKTQRVADQRPASLNFLVFLLLALCGVVYLFLVNSSTTAGYEISELQRAITELRETNKRLQLESSALRSIQHIETTVKNLNLVPSTNVQYMPERDYAYENEP